QRYREGLLEEIPAIDAVLGTGDIHRLPQVIQQTLAGERLALIGEPKNLYEAGTPRILTGRGHSAYVKIAEGCDHRCSFCIIPQLRGPLRSRSMESIYEEVETLVAQGVQEIIIIAQDTTSYGLDRYNRPMLASLLQKLVGIRGLAWLRVLYTYPTNFTPELMELLAGERKLCTYVDLPLQHINDQILKRMYRRGRRRQIEALVASLKEIPGMVLRSSFIVGFPGEREVHFRELLAFLRDVQFDHVGIFAFSPQGESPAGRWADQIPEGVKELRRRRAMETQAAISRRRNRDRIGTIQEVLIEEVTEAGSVGRTRGQAPEVDGITYLPGQQLQPGQIVRAKIVGGGTYDLFAQIARTGTL
ncbi:MAG: 30S ribosomal protein S12 methylthiotransferase RimO, partial [Limnochordia bacterium]